MAKNGRKYRGETKEERERREAKADQFFKRAVSMLKPPKVDTEEIAELHKGLHIPPGLSEEEAQKLRTEFGYAQLTLKLLAMIASWSYTGLPFDFQPLYLQQLKRRERAMKRKG
ncbi:hypothetical protein [Noviherbaspirillum galbum]|uniref:Uncharacterized protein n=1 Tax=Noviherbaspirillum galbum TaxID=2709383 RepID=A0A6B3SVX1_9BURK|nr:hypothetical protein [Noviherbaspirillum galbum]NEX64907.1 hypothetical protein [Noviherbaspirillum galbum]